MNNTQNKFIPPPQKKKKPTLFLNFSHHASGSSKSFDSINGLTQWNYIMVLPLVLNFCTDLSLFMHILSNVMALSLSLKA
jgi:hypothetical protein